MDKGQLSNGIAAWIASVERRVQQSGKTGSVILSRRFDFGIEKIWTACTDSDQLRKWFGNVTSESGEGKTVKIDVGAPCHISSKILLCEAPHHLIITWCYGEVLPDQIDEVEVRLSTEGDKTLMVLEHRSEAQGDWWFGAGSGWEFALIKLQILLQDGNPASLSVDEIDQELGRVWSSLGNR